MNSNESTRREVLAGGGMAALAAALCAPGADAQEVPLNAMQPTAEQLGMFMRLPDGPIVMVNLLKFKADGGAAAYQKYGAAVEPLLEGLGAKILFQGQCKGALIGGASWDAVALVQYPSKMALMQMAQSPEYQAIHHHREEGLEGQINLAVVEGNTLA